MLRLDLNELARAGTLRVEAEIPGDAPLWEDADLDFEPGTGLEVDLTASQAGKDQVVVRGTIRARFQKPCRRCLQELEVDFEEDLAILFAPMDELEDDDPDIRKLEPRGSELELAQPIREEVILAAPTYVECGDECQGLCPQCGVNLNETDCDCSVEVRDPRWDALRALKKD